jgi:sec-independent protein translocase protein TatC
MEAPSEPPREHNRKGTVPVWEDEKRMSFTEHLGELRDRIIKSGIAFAVLVLICYIFSDQLYKVLAGPLLIEGATPQIIVADSDESLRVAFTKFLEDEGYAVSTADTYDAALTLVRSARYHVMVAAAQIGEETALDLLRTLAEEKRQIVVLVVADSADEAAAAKAVEEGAFDYLSRPVTGSALKQAVRLALEKRDTTGELEKINWITLDPLEGILVKVKIAVYGGLLFAFPYILWHICGFVFPGLRPSERKVVQVGIVGCALLAIFGVCVAYFAIFPIVLPFILQWVPENIEVQLQMSKTIVIIIKGLLIFGLVFQFPMVVLVLVYLGILTPESLRKNRRFAIVGLAFAAAIFTPPDIMTMLIMMIPLLALYELSILVSYLVVWKKQKQAKAEGS